LKFPPSDLILKATEFEASHPKWANIIKNYWQGKILESVENPIPKRIAEKTEGYDISNLKFAGDGPIDISTFVGRFVLPRAEGNK